MRPFDLLCVATDAKTNAKEAGGGRRRQTETTEDLNKH